VSGEEEIVEEIRDEEKTEKVVDGMVVLSKKQQNSKV
jgi:hypothetical protein